MRSPLRHGRLALLAVASLPSVLAVLSALTPLAKADETTRISSAPSGAAGSAESFRASISGDGRVIAFTSAANDLVAGDTNFVRDIFVLDRSSGVLARASVDSRGVQGNGHSETPAVAADGASVAFSSRSSNLDTDPNGALEDIFVRDLAAGTTRRISVDTGGLGANAPCFSASISADGVRVAFESAASDLVAGDTNGVRDVFVRDRSGAGSTILASVDEHGVQGNADSFDAQLSDDGDVVVFWTFATSFPDPPAPGHGALYAKTLSTGRLERVDVDPAGVGVEFPRLGGINGDGSLVVFETMSALVPEDGNGFFDVYLRDRVAGTTTRVSLAAGGRELALGAYAGRLSRDGRFLVFTSDSHDVVEHDGNGCGDVFVRDLLHDATQRLSVGTLDEEGSASSAIYALSTASVLSDDGGAVVFESVATEFAPGDGNGASDVFLRVRDLLAASSTHYGTGFPGRGGTIPAIVPDDAPIRGSLLDLDLQTSSHLYTVGFLLVGVARDSTPTRLGGTLLVVPFAVMALPLDPFGNSLSALVPTNHWANGLIVDLQLLELDPFAAAGVSFSDGLELVLGDG